MDVYIVEKATGTETSIEIAHWRDGVVGELMVGLSHHTQQEDLYMYLSRIAVHSSTIKTSSHHSEGQRATLSKHDLANLVTESRCSKVIHSPEPAPPCHTDAD